MFTEFRALALITTPLLPLLLKKPLRVLHFLDCPPRYTCFSPLAQAISPQARNGGRSHLIKLIGGKADAGEPRPAWVDEGARWRSCTGKAPLYTSFLAHWLIDDHAILYPYICVQALWRSRVHVRRLAALQRLGNRR